jgi:hypothetical protein
MSFHHSSQAEEWLLLAAKKLPQERYKVISKFLLCLFLDLSAQRIPSDVTEHCGMISSPFWSLADKSLLGLVVLRSDALSYD